MDRDGKQAYRALVARLDHDGMDGDALKRLGALCHKADAIDPVSTDDAAVDFRADVFRSVWREAAAFRRNGALLERARQVACPVVAVHGDLDPHPAEGVQRPLAAVLASFQFHLLEKCGHKPWTERHARKAFFSILEAQLS